jgi:DNA-damage-inducible protein J
MTMEVQATVDEQLGQKAEAILAEAGLTASDVLSMVMRRVVAEESVPLDLFLPNEETLEAMEELRNGGGATFHSVEALMADLNADD